MAKIAQPSTADLLELVKTEKEKWLDFSEIEAITKLNGTKFINNDTLRQLLDAENFSSVIKKRYNSEKYILGGRVTSNLLTDRDVVAGLPEFFEYIDILFIQPGRFGEDITKKIAYHCKICQTFRIGSPDIKLLQSNPDGRDRILYVCKDETCEHSPLAVPYRVQL